MNKEYSKQLGEKIGEMLYMKMYHVDYHWYDIGRPSWIQITPEEKSILEKIEKYYGKTNKKSDWNKVLRYQTELEHKYLPKTITEYIDFSEEVDLVEFKDGLKWYLWNTDFCSYSLKTMKITVEGNIITVVLTLPEIGENDWS